MTFSESVRTCLREKYATFSGRASRSEFWWFALANFLISMALNLIGLAIFGSIASMFAGDAAGAGLSMGFIVWTIIQLLVGIALLIPSIAVGIRRCHDRNLTGWIYGGLMIGLFIPFINIIALIGFLIVLVLFMMKGTEGPNKYGPDPLGAGDAEIFS